MGVEQKNYQGGIRVNGIHPLVGIAVLCQGEQEIVLRIAVHFVI